MLPVILVWRAQFPGLRSLGSDEQRSYCAMGSASRPCRRRPDVNRTQPPGFACRRRTGSRMRELSKLRTAEGTLRSLRDQILTAPTGGKFHSFKETLTKRPELVSAVATAWAVESDPMIVMSSVFSPSTGTFISPASMFPFPRYGLTRLAN
jgi:hypothetical protein